jgi:glycosyltransferase involved in cell wall biosynthesis
MMVARMHTAVFSIISPNYRHYARVLMASLQQQHPEWDRFLLLVGGDGAPERDDAFTTVSLDELPLPHRAQFTFRYTILELNTAVKPWMFAHLFARGYDRVVYFDPDIVVYSRLEELDALPADSMLAVTPHLTGSIPGDDHPSERTILLAGTYNLGFLAARRQPQLERFLAWWQEKLETQCVNEPARGLFVDQKWIDLTPGLFAGVTILRHDGYNVAYWNLEQRTVTASGDRFSVNGQPLRFFHFSGFDPATPHAVSRHQHRRVTGDVGDAARLIAAYGAALRTAGYESTRRANYKYATFADGTPLPDNARYAYRNSPELQAACGADPFQHPELFVGIRDTRRASRFRARVGVISYRILSRARPLVLLLPRSLRTTLRERLLGRKDPAPPVHDAGSLPPGLNVAGYLNRDTGVGESARLCLESAEAAGLAVHRINVDPVDERAPQAVYRATVHHVNADQVPAVHADLRAVFDASGYNIGCWHWELPELPDAWIASAAPFDELWAPSAFVQSALSRKLTIPVVHMPHGIALSAIEPCTPEELGVPRGRFTFLCMFDLGSVVERKNPMGAVDAFRRAFPNDSSAALLVKVGHADEHPADYAALKEQLRDVPNVYLTHQMLSRPRVNGLLAACDAVVSLHRSEGFGLVLAEAMSLAKPVIATGWSGNMDFMDSGNSCPVAYDLVTLLRTYGVYEAGQQWAEPDVEHAAHLMRRIVDDASHRSRVAERARETIRTRFSPAAAGARYQQRLAFLGLLASHTHRLV